MQSGDKQMPLKTTFYTSIFLYSFCFLVSANAIRSGSDHQKKTPLSIKPPAINERVEVKPQLPSDIANDDGDQYISNPISIYNGNKRETQTDVSITTPIANGLTFTRYYNSRLEHNNALGFGWSHQFGDVITYIEFNGANYLRITKANGWHVFFAEETGGRWGGAFKERTHLMAENDGYTWFHRDGTRYHFSLPGELTLGAVDRLTWVEDVHGNRQTFAYDTAERLQSITDAASGRILTFHYNTDNRIAHISGPVTAAVSDGFWVHYGYDTNENLTSVTYADGSGFTYEYNDTNDPHNLTEKRDKLDHVLATWTYDVFDRAYVSTTRDGRGVTIDYLGEGLVKVTNAYGKTRTYHIRKIGGIKRITQIDDAQGCSSCGDQTVRYVYDDDLRVTEKEYANGAIDQFSNFDANGRAQTVVENVGTALSKTIYYTYHPVTGQMLSQAEPSVLGSGNKVVIYDYDDDGNDTPNENPGPLMIRMIERGFTYGTGGTMVPYETITAFQHNDKGQLLSIDGPLPGSQDTVSYNYDAINGNLLAMTQPMVGTTTYANHDGAGNPGTMTDVNGVVTQYTYDGQNRLLISRTARVTTSRSYSTAGDLQTVTDGEGRMITYHYDTTHGRLEKVSDALGNSLRYQYDANGNRIEDGAFDTGGTRRRYTRYDYQHPQWAGKLYQTIHPDGSAITYDYDAMGNRTSVINELNRPTIYGHDLRNRLFQVIEPGSVTTGYDYNPQDHLIRVTDAKGNVTEYTTDDIGRVVKVVSPDTHTTLYEYDEADNLNSKTDAKGITTTYLYDTLNRLTHIVYPNPAENVTLNYDAGTNGKGRVTTMTDRSGSTDFLYNPAGQVIRETRIMEGVTYITEYTYDDAGNLQTIIHPSGRVVIYLRDNAGQITGTTVDGQSITGQVAYLPFGPTTGMTLGAGILEINRVFDERYQLTQNTAGSITDYHYTRDPVGNIVSITGVGEPNATGGTTNYNHQGNRLIEASGQEAAQYTYDDNGNVISDGARTFVYNQNNRLIRVEQGGNVLGEYAYDGLERRVKKTVSGTTTHYHYDLMGNLIAQTSSDGTPFRDVFYQNGERVAMEIYGARAGTYYFLNDHLGTPHTLIDESAQVVWQAAYLPFGKAQIMTETIENHFRFPGQYYDFETGLHYNWHRYYDPNLGRYLRADPIGLEGEINLFQYVQNNPVNLFDLKGLKGCGPGSGFWEWVIPDNPFGFNFESCCDKHDECYGCKGKAQKKTRRDCDIQFCKCLVKKCLNYNALFKHCPSVEYCLFTATFGGRSFEKGRKCCP